ncbi:MAG: formylglycine-generating enzyme family protein [Deltaproteobacteria bacterium]|nr:formylglycine-generating enzyme family protein [Deltaproteobacteria bacterium]
MVAVPGGVFGMGIDAQELGDAVRACVEEFREQLGTNACQRSVNNPNPPFSDAYTGAERRLVHVAAFEIDRFEVTTRQYRACAATGRCDPRPLVSGDLRYIRDEWPIVNVTWFDARDYCAFHGKRLPTEAEWEKAARGTSGARWPWGNFLRSDGANHGSIEAEEVSPPHPELPQPATDDADGAKLLVPPGTFRWGRSPYGAYDMAGNVSEWISDWYLQEGYDSLSPIDPKGPIAGTQSYRVVRGGSFFEPKFFGRTYYREAQDPQRRSIKRGFRCARDLVGEANPWATNSE